MEIRSVLGTFLGKAGAVAGAALGLATIAFFAGFLVQRAQANAAKIPHVYLDYWASAEVGVVALLRSAFLLLDPPWTVAGLLAITLTLVLAMDSERFRHAVLRPQWLFLGTLLLVCLVYALLGQQLAIRTAHTSQVVTAASDYMRESDLSAPVPGVGVFGWFVREKAEPPVVLPWLDSTGTDTTKFATPAIEAWERIATELEARSAEASAGLPVRPRPFWASPDIEEIDPILGVVVPDDLMEPRRALRLFQGTLRVFAAAIWGLAIVAVWQRKVLAVMHTRARRGPWARVGAGLWSASRWVLAPLAATGLLLSAVFLVPDNYGALALPAIGHEYVEVFATEGTSDPDAPPQEDPPSSSSGEVAEIAEAIGKPFANFHDATLFLSGLCDRYASGDPDARRRVVERWTNAIRYLENRGTPFSVTLLKSAVQLSRYVAPELMDLAHRAWIRARNQTESPHTGYILHYPRSSIDNLRLITTGASDISRWSIYPIPTERILEIQVSKGSPAETLITLLRQMKRLDVSGRLETIVEAQLIGHAATLEIVMAGVLDPHRDVRAACVTSTGLYGRALGSSVTDILRKNRAARLLVDVLGDELELPSIRQSAATALWLLRVEGDPLVGKTLLDHLQDDQGDPDWILRGTTITALGKLRVRKAVTPLVNLLHRKDVPLRIKETIPTALRSIGESVESARGICAFLNDASAHGKETTTTIRSAAAILGLIAAEAPGPEQQLAFDSLMSLARRHTDFDAQRAIVIGIAEMNFAPSREFLEEVSDEHRDVKSRVLAIEGLVDLQHPASEEILVDLTQDRREPIELRITAMRALSKFDDNRSLDPIYQVWENELKRHLLGKSTNDLLNEIRSGNIAVIHAYMLAITVMDTLENRARRGSGMAASLAIQLAEDEAYQALGTVQDLAALPRIQFDPDPMTGEQTVLPLEAGFEQDG